MKLKQNRLIVVTCFLLCVASLDAIIRIVPQGQSVIERDGQFFVIAENSSIGNIECEINLDDECPICGDPFVQPDQSLRIVNQLIQVGCCRKLFCFACLKQWTDQCPAASCPNCRCPHRCE